jgi:hypothetical protein
MPRFTHFQSVFILRILPTFAIIYCSIYVVHILIYVFKKSPEKENGGSQIKTRKLMSTFNVITASEQ